MYLILLSATLLSTATAIVHNNQYLNSTYRGLKGHKVVAPWDKAQKICQSEGGYLASPISADLLDDMKYFIGANRRYNTYLIGTRASPDIPGQYVSIEGVVLEDMPVLHMLEWLDPDQGDCLSMDEHTISVVPCWTPLPYLCRLNDTLLSNTILNDTMLNSTTLNNTSSDNTALDNTSLDNTSLENTTLNNTILNPTTKPDCTIEGYKYAPSTRQCYKYHNDWKSWYDAEAKCVTEGGHLLVINDVNEIETIKELYTNRSAILFIGLRDWSSGDGDWKSVDGIPMEQLWNGWDEGYIPHNSLLACGYLRQSWQIGSMVCDIITHFICEKQPDQDALQLEATKQ